MTGFWTLVGPDYAGKSTVLERLHAEHGWQVVSCDDRYLDRYPLIRQLRETWVASAFSSLGLRYSAELVVSVLHPIVLHLRDELARAGGQDRVIADSYYYKLLAKCRLFGADHRPTFDYWRSFPRPRGVLYLDVPAEVAWARSGDGANLHVFEHYGNTADLAGFARLQSDFREAVIEEVGDVPLTFIDGSGEPDAVLSEVLAALGMAVLR